VDDAGSGDFRHPRIVGAGVRLPGRGNRSRLRRIVEGQEQRRSYSICAAVGDKPRVGVREVPGGLISGWLVRDVRVGDEVEIQTPSGTFVADPDVAARHVLIAAGSGITPVLSIAASVLANPGSHVTVFYGNRRSNSVMFAEDLSDLKDTYGSRLELIHVLSREPRGVDMFTGRLDADRVRCSSRASCRYLLSTTSGCAVPSG